uniref:Melanocortin-2 receptor accessory protein n=1 Tax=Malurus cyaneus samueli TaxID=2593467 RepID=A0A8C5TXK5_9PASS
MANRTNSSEYFWSYEYYWDYIDPIPVDGSKLKVNKYSIVIAFWVGLAAFVTFLFLVLLCMSCSGSTPANNDLQRSRLHTGDPFSLRICLDCPLSHRSSLSDLDAENSAQHAGQGFRIRSQASRGKQQ